MLRKYPAIAAVCFLAINSAPATVNAQPEAFGKWVTLFNGKDTAGWVKAKKDAGKPCGWVVEDGALTNNGAEMVDICTKAEDFDNYELEVEYKLPKDHGNSGVYLNGQIEVQVHSTPPTEKNLQTGHLCGIYSKVAPKRNPMYKAGAWNQFRIRHIGNRITVWHNGVYVQDDVYVDGKTGGAMGKSAITGKPLSLERGPIMLQGNHSRVWFRNIRIRRLASPADGWRSLWNGKDLSQFTAGNRKIGDFWTVSPTEHALTNKKWYNGPSKGDGGCDIWTKGKFGNFLVHWEYKSDPNQGSGNSGFYFRDQWEVQINKHQSTKDIHGDGALYSWRAPRVLARNGPDEWNQMEARVEGMKMWVWQNGKLIQDGVELTKRTDNHGAAATDASVKRPFKLQGDHDRVWFANIWIKPLD